MKVDEPDPKIVDEALAVLASKSNSYVQAAYKLAHYIVKGGTFMKHQAYSPKSLKAKLGYLVEECGEVMQAVDKSLRHGLEGVNPELEDALKTETNRDWILRELDDLDHAIDLVRAELKAY